MALTFPSGPTPGQTYVGPNNITYTWDNTLGVWTGSSPAAGGLTAASLAQAAAGTLNTVASTPQTAVPKDASGMTGAGILPSGTDAQRAAIATPVVGMQRFNTTSGYEEVYTGATLGWRNLEFVAEYDPDPTDLVIAANTTLEGNILCKNLTVNAGVTVTVANYGVVIRCTETATINGSINADFAGGIGSGFASPGYGAGQGRQDFAETSSGWSGPGATGKSYAPGFYLGGSAPLSSYAYVDATSVNAGFSRTQGGNGGGCIAVVAGGAITVSATSTLSARGQAGGSYPSATGVAAMMGCSGGSGGTVILRSNQSLSMAGTINVSGGVGGGAGCAGVGCNGGLGGGNGGGGGTVVLQSPSTSNTGTVTLTGGAGGTGINGGGVGTQLSAAAGGGNGGTGGAPQLANAPVNGSAGSAGVIVFSGSPF